MNPEVGVEQPIRERKAVPIGETGRTERRRQMFEFNRFDCYGNEYVCLFKDGTHHVFLVEGDERFEEFTGTYEECVGFVENTLLAARESMY